MTGPVEDALRAAVHKLADGARPAPDLAVRALGRGRRLRRRRRALAAGGAVVAVVAIALPFVLLRPQPAARPATPHPTATVTPAPPVRPVPGPDWSAKPLVLPGDWVVTGGTFVGAPGKGFVLDRIRGRYLVADGYDGVFPAPVGSLSAVTDTDRPRAVGLVDLARGTTRWYEVGRALSAPQWSPDGRRLLFTTHQLDRFGFILLDPDGKRRTFRVDRERYFCTDQCDFTWSRDGTEVLLPQTGQADHDESVRDLRAGVRLFSAADGRPTRFLPVPGDPAGPLAWSPDGKLVVVQGQQDPLLVETATGRVVRTLPTAEVVWISDDRLLYRRPYGARDVVLADLTGRELVRQPLPKELVDRQLTVGPR
ncbi:PD40 domain-containing protein [Micromonospora coerulea]|uniref:PD40 domain-containing protein n=1 Tax=Micromonospora coerulea TaxID=47856 RepID=UPI0019066B3F|nr:PD40 domain-containing protein [Micromonospora veneta]